MKSDRHPEESTEDLPWGDIVSWLVSHRGGGTGRRKRETELPAEKRGGPLPRDAGAKNSGEERRKKAEAEKGRALEAARSAGKGAMECAVCGREIRINQAFRSLPGGGGCRQGGVYHLRTCGPGSKRWKACGAEGQKALGESISGGQLSFEWTK